MNEHITNQELIVLGFSNSKKQNTKTMGSAEGKFSAGHLVQMWNFVAGCWSSTDFFFPHKKSQQSIVTQRATCGCLEVI